jgi:hypothetical protein
MVIMAFTHAMIGELVTRLVALMEEEAPVILNTRVALAVTTEFTPACG